MRSILFVFLLPLFFVFHGYVENYRFINFSDCLLLIVLYTIATLAVYLCFKLLLKQKMKAALMTTFIMSFYFFFGALHDFFRQNSIFLHKYSVIIPLFLLMAGGLFLYLKKRQPDTRISLFLNTLLIIYLLIDAMTPLWHRQDTGAISKFTQGAQDNLYKHCDSCPKPDIYFLLFDEYSGNNTLKNVYHYNNDDLDTFLQQQGFQIQKNSRSNYNFTAFSMTSMLSTSYLTNIKAPSHITANDYLEATGPNRKLTVINTLLDQGYTVINNSSFDLPTAPSFSEQPFIAVKTKLITDRTLSSYLLRDMGWWLVATFHHSLKALEDHNEEIGRQNQVFIDKTIEESKKPSTSPRFIYMHVFMPHFPFLYDSLGQARDLAAVTEDYNHPADPRSYLNYIPYTNACLKKLVSAIKKNTDGKAVIIFMSDHGYRLAGMKDRNAVFNNQDAVYLPGKDHGQLYDSISAVNEFRVVLNQIFRQNAPLLKDSFIYLKDDDGNGNTGL